MAWCTVKERGQHLYLYHWTPRIVRGRRTKKNKKKKNELVTEMSLYHVLRFSPGEQVAALSSPIPNLCRVRGCVFKCRYECLSGESQGR